MKTLYSAVALIALFTLNACTKPNISNNNHPLEGAWNLSSYWAFTHEPLPTFSSNEVEWKFNFEQNQLIVTYNVEVAYPYLIEEGVHSLSEGASSNLINIDDNTYVFNLENGLLNIKNYYAEGVIADLPECNFVKQ